MKKHRRKLIAAALALLLIAGFVFQDYFVRLYVYLNDGSLDHYAWDSLVCTEGHLSVRYGPWDTAVWREAGIVEFYTRRSPAFGGVEKGFYYSKSDTPVSFQAAGYPLMEDGAGWSWADPYGNHGYTRRIRPHWFWFEAVL